MLPWERFHGEAGVSRLPRQPPMTRAQRIGQPEAKGQGFPRRTEEQRARTEEQRARTGEQRARTGEQRARMGEQRARTGERQRRTEERRVRRKAAAVAAVGEDSHTSQKTNPRTEGSPTGRERVETTPEWCRSPRGPDQKTAGPETTERTSTEPVTAPEGRGSGRLQEDFADRTALQKKHGAEDKKERALDGIHIPPMLRVTNRHWACTEVI
ncbi:hypothetical protein NDU88_011034 [Pleurodeles waltl]|uniref:Uncharacterized protein n=1 Tax=Pleurodeles waltl TaxID=8319 RepID=A0AAV7S5T2_PLEWA|nr:hypothetical protein NDU88_011034 [Pleurodeles waltl]